MHRCRSRSARWVSRIAATLILRPSVCSSIARISAAACVWSPVSMTIQPAGASIAKLLAIPQPRIAYTPSVTRSTRFASPMPHLSLASSAASVVTAPFGPTTVSPRSDGLLQEGDAPRVSWAWTVRQGTSSSPQIAAINDFRPILIPVPLQSIPMHGKDTPRPLLLD